MREGDGASTPDVRPLSLDERKVLVASFLTLAAEFTHVRGEGDSEARAAVALRDHALALAITPLEGRDARRLDEFLSDWSRDVRRMASSYPRPAYHSTRRRRSGRQRRAMGDGHRALGLSLWRGVRALRCRACPGSRERLCGTRVQARTAARGACMAELDALFREALQAARALYRWGGVPPRDVEGCRVSMVVTRAARRVGGGLAGLGVEAWSWFDGTRDREDDACTIVLALPLDEMSLRVMQALPYVLLHECIAHAFQRVGAVSRATSAHDPVAEGWMDFVARFVFVRGMQRGVGIRRSHAAWHSNVMPGLLLSEARRATRRGAGSGGAVQLGYDVAERLWALLVGARGREGMRMFLRLSCQLNVRPLSEFERRRVVTGLSRILPAPGDAPREGRRVRHPSLRALVRGEGVQSFIDRILSQ